MAKPRLDLKDSGEPVADSLPLEQPLPASSEPVEPAIDPASPERFVNRELSWLAFNRRVLEEAQNSRHPLLERLRFLSISASNLDEFYMVRVAGLKGMVAAGVATLSDDGLTPAQQIARVEQMAGELIADQQTEWASLRKMLREVGVAVLDPEELSETDRLWLDREFREGIFPVLTPLALDPSHPFPFIPNLGFTLALRLSRKKDGKAINALLPVPSQLQRFVRLPGEGTRFVATRFWARACSASSATATSKWKKRPRISCCCSRRCSSAGAAAL